jgi:hypothetical protein
MAYYYPNARERLTYLLDRDAAVKQIGTDSAEVSLERLPRSIGINVVHRPEFLARYPRFLMYSRPALPDWLYAQLSEDGFLIRPVAVTRDPASLRILYLVESSAIG